MKFELLPNEIFIECFQYLNAPDIFYSFDRLNYRFHTLIRNIPLHVNFEQFKKSLLNEFCQIILSNPEIKQNIISLQLSNKGTCGQIQSFLSLISLNEFIHLRSLSLIDFQDDNIEQLLPMLPFLSNLYCFSFTSLDYGTLEIIPVLFKSKIRILTIPQFDFYLTPIYEIMSITSLTIAETHLLSLCKLFKYIPILKYLQIERFYSSEIKDDKLDFINTNAVYLKQFIVHYSTVKFQVLDLLLKRTPNLKIFSIFAPDEIEMIDANRWQHLIESSLPHLHVFKFNFCYCSRDSYNEQLIKLQQFQTDFWHKQHHWYTDCEIDDVSSSVYTIPYIRNEYQLRSTVNRYSNSLISNSSRFDNVKKLSLETRTIRNDSPYYFRNVQSLKLEGGCDYYGKTVEYQLQTRQIEFLNMIVNLSNIKHLTIPDERYITSSLLLEIFQKIPNVSSLAITKGSLISYLTNRPLCEYLNRKIKTLGVSRDWNGRYIPSNEIDLFYKTFSNVEHLQCYIKNLDDLLLILAKCSKLLVIELEVINEEIYSWIQINASTLNVYLNFRSIGDGDDDD